MDFYKIGALKVFFELGQLIEDDESKQTTILDLPDDIIHNNITKYLLEDKQINKIFSKKDDYYLLNFLCNKIWDVKYIKPNAWNEYKTNINLDCIKHYLNIRHNLNCDSLKIMYRVAAWRSWQLRCLRDRVGPSSSPHHTSPTHDTCLCCRW